MRVGLDLWHATAARGGIGRYASELTRALVRLNEAVRSNEFVLFPGQEEPAWISEALADGSSRVRLGSDKWQGRRKGFPTRILRSNLRVAFQLRAHQLDVFHCTDFFDTPLMSLGRTRVVATVHDISPILYPETVTRRHAMFFRAFIKPMLHRAHSLITVSRASAGEILEWNRALEDKLSIVYLGVSEEFRRADPDVVEVMRRVYALPDEYLLCLGTVQPRKNVRRLVEGYSLLAATDRDIPPLVVAGGLGWLYEPILEQVSECGIDGRVKFLGFVPDSDLPGLLTGASAFVFPSIHEGFGLPVLEAMACGTPVVTSNRSSLPEVAGDAAVLVDPFDAESIAEGLRTVLCDTTKAADLARRGLQRAATFTWTETAHRTLEVYKHCAGT